MIGIARDISARKRAEAELTAANRELQRLGQLKDEFLSTVSHELRTPLAAILNATAILGKGKAGALNADQARFVEMVREHVRRLHRLVDDVLDFQKLEAGSMSFNAVPTDLRPLVREALEGYAPVFAERGLSLAVTMPEEPLTALVDRDRLTQVLLNLLSNAAKFTPAGGRVVVGAERGPGEVRLRVADTGLGLAPEDLERVFQRFVQVDGGLTRQVGGTGLGLSICKKIVEDGHQGRIWAEGALGVGTTIHLALPAC